CSTHQGVRSVAGESSYRDGSAGIFGRALTIRFDAALAGLVLRYTFHCERAEGRILAADLVLRIASDVAPRLDFVHVVELENDDAVRWRLSGYRKCLIEPTCDVFAPIVIQRLLRRWEEVIFIAALVLDRDF